MNEHELSAGLRAIHQRRASMGDVEAVRHHVLTAPIQEIPQQRRWLPRIDTGRFQTMSSALKFVVAGAIVALFGGFLLTGGLMQRSSDEQLPAVGASASTQAEPTDAVPTSPGPSAAADADDANPTLDILPGVDLVTEEIEPGVYRVSGDGVRDLVRFADRREGPTFGVVDGTVVAGLDGSVWWFDRDGFFRLGEETTHRWPTRPGTDSARTQAIEVGPDGTVWLTAWFGVPGSSARIDISSYGSQRWSKRWRGAYAKRFAYDVAVQQDGTVWMAWWTRTGEDGFGPVRAARLADDGWEVLPGSVASPGNHNYGHVLTAQGGGNDVWVTDLAGLHRHDGEGWVAQETPDLGGVTRAAVGPDGTLWVRLLADCGLVCLGPSDILARFDGSDWETYDSSDGIPMMEEGFFEVAPDASIWFNPIGDHERTGTACDGIASFDGEAVAYFLRDTCIYAMDLAPDGTVWLQAGDDYGDARARGWREDGRGRFGPIHTYVITPDAVAATE